MTTPLTKNVIGGIRKNKGAVQTACTNDQNSVPSSAKQQRENITFVVLTTISAFNAKHLIPWSAQQLNCSVLCECQQDGTIAK